MILIDVLPAESYQQFHIEGAINVPLDDHFTERIQQITLNLSQLIVVYSLDFDCSHSSEALQRLRDLGYQNLFDYEPGKIDWSAAQLPTRQGRPESTQEQK